MDTTRVKKLDLTEEIVNIAVKNTTGYASLGESLGQCFSVDDLRENDQTKKYLEENTGEILRKYLKVSNCRKIGKPAEASLTEGDLVVILRFVLRNWPNYCLKNSRKYVSGDRRRFYWIDKN